VGDLVSIVLTGYGQPLSSERCWLDEMPASLVIDDDAHLLVLKCAAATHSDRTPAAYAGHCLGMASS
jgi:hypothetical protein